ncbi:PAS domain-containing protein [Minwuia thermotolerans]|uniref:PAS domain-containing protein n=1 Tax=Minwuia thermotolerans TaxID=2056226 RepID=A0A2M9G493_9PROT|nr:PAS domain-containing protein [Minwuia thermotolerans]PJK30531.1 hypothetical protein CVT23_06195 [Minwuia thermotolerans]
MELPEHSSRYVTVLAEGEDALARADGHFRPAIEMWRAGGGPLPDRRTLDPARLGRLLDSVLLLKREGDDLIHRIAGGGFIASNGDFDPTSHGIGELSATRRVARVLAPVYFDVVQRPRPVLVDIVYADDGETLADAEMLMLPYGDGESGGGLSHVLSVYRFRE